MSNFPEEERYLLVDELYEHYDLGFEDSTKIVYVYCHRCDDVVAELGYDEIKKKEGTKLYETIINSHRNL